jgi:hypothetical protein
MGYLLGDDCLTNTDVAWLPGHLAVSGCARNAAKKPLLHGCTLRHPDQDNLALLSA